MPEKTQEKKEANIVKEETKELIMTLKSYNEIFSDFDSRPYNQRILSDDFIEELNREYRDMPSEKIRLKLLIPENQRNQEEETIIKKRINDYFKQRYIANYKTYKNKIKSGIWLIIIGIILTAIYIFLITKIEILKISFLETIIFQTLQITNYKAGISFNKNSITKLQVEIDKYEQQNNTRT